MQFCWAIITLTKYSHVPSHVLLLRSPINTTNGRTLTTENLLLSSLNDMLLGSYAYEKQQVGEWLRVFKAFSRIHALQVSMHLFSHTCP